MESGSGSAPASAIAASIILVGRPGLRMSRARIDCFTALRRAWSVRRADGEGVSLDSLISSSSTTHRPCELPVYMDRCGPACLLLSKIVTRSSMSLMP
jgi:hypothetical protein